MLDQPVEEFEDPNMMVIDTVQAEPRPVPK